MARLNGWWRIWISIALIWSALCIFVGVMMFKDIGTPESRAAEEIKWDCTSYSPDGDIQINEKYAKDEVLRAALRIDTDPSVSDHIKHDLKKCAAALSKDYVAEVRHKSTALAFNLALFIAIPPALLLLLGSAIAWIRRGFRDASLSRN